MLSLAAAVLSVFSGRADIYTLLYPGTLWEYTFTNPTSDPAWNSTSGDWTTGLAPFGNEFTGDFAFATLWTSDFIEGNDDLWVRTTVDLTGFDLSTVHWDLGVDNGFKLYANGILVASATAHGYTFRWEYSGGFGGALVSGVNYIALALDDYGTSTAFDMQITGSPNLPFGVDAAVSPGQHAGQTIDIPLNVDGQPTSDPRSVVDEIVVHFSIPVRPHLGPLLPEKITITSSPDSLIPDYTVFFSEGGYIGQELNILFSAPLLDQHRYHVSFGQFSDAGGRVLINNAIEFRVLQGDANGNGVVTATDVSFVRGLINQPAGPGPASRADLNMSGSVTGPDISFVRSRIGHSAP
jgi:hypothetical protein